MRGHVPVEIGNLEAQIRMERDCRSARAPDRKGLLAEFAQAHAE